VGEGNLGVVRRRAGLGSRVEQDLRHGVRGVLCAVASDGTSPVQRGPACPVCQVNVHRHALYQQPHDFHVPLLCSQVQRALAHQAFDVRVVLEIPLGGRHLPSRPVLKRAYHEFLHAPSVPGSARSVYVRAELVSALMDKRHGNTGGNTGIM
jgi:hypothetical protein